MSDLVHFGPHAGAHRVALRAAASVLVPLLALVLLGRPEWTIFAAFGAFTSLYGRTARHPERAGQQIWVGVILTLAVTAGAAVSLMPHRDVVVIVSGTLVAAAASLISDATHWHPPGPLFPVFAFTATTSLPSDPTNVPIAFGVAAASAVFSIMVGHSGAVPDPRARGRVNVPTLSPREVWQVAANRRRAALFAVGVFVAGIVGAAIGTRYGGTHAYWAMVAVVAGLTGASRRARLTRGLHRLIGTFAGVGFAALLLPLHPRGVIAVLLVVALQGAAELLVGRNYAVALIFVTPLALMMGQLGHEVPVGPLLVDRAVETAIGCLVAMAMLYATRFRARYSGR